jgi:predicted nucleic-acid-binding protein
MKKRYKVTKEQLEMVVESLVSDNSLVENKEEVLEEGMFDRLKMKFKSKIESFLDKLSQSDYS